jgi:hypothetical protein
LLEIAGVQKIQLDRGMASFIKNSYSFGLLAFEKTYFKRV